LSFADLRFVNIEITYGYNFEVNDSGRD